MQLYDKITTLKGVGAKKAAYLEKLRIRTIEDFLYYYPREYQDRRNPTKIDTLQENGENVLIRAKVVLIVPGGFGARRNLQILVRDETGELPVVFFHAEYLLKTIAIDTVYDLYGKITSRGGRLQMVHPEISRSVESQLREVLLPVYPLTEGLRQSELRKWQEEAIPCMEELEEYLPEDIVSRNRLCDLPYAIRNIHFPEDPQKLRIAKFRLIFDELLQLQLGLLSLKARFSGMQKGISFSKKVDIDDFIKTLPFPMTGAQNRVLTEIMNDMESDQVMNRLIQGDVGSGKTVVAAAAAYKAIRSGYQAAMMAPTELLASQHLITLTELFSPLRIRVGCLTGSLAPKERKKILEELKNGEIDFLIGTHALIQPDVILPNLGLVITDEQHRFGVRQRGLLQKKGINPDIIVMTATPIPRTLAVILYGDLDISVIDELPPGRKPVITKAILPSEREKAYQFIREETKKGRQAYVVAPLIEESMEIDARSARELFNELTEHFGKARIRLLHGAMKQTEKDEAMNAFINREVDILVSTVVIEVGINIPNASIMLIENAERFGLAALHQLRGRVGRGAEQSYCFLVTESKTKMAQERTKVLCDTTDGFLIAEKDLELRGPGEFFGFRQHGLPELRLADPVRHFAIMETARAEAFRLLTDDPSLTKTENCGIKQRIELIFEDVGGLSI